jgi:hypothetical protein
LKSHADATRTANGLFFEFRVHGKYVGRQMNNGLIGTLHIWRLRRLRVGTSEGIDLSQQEKNLIPGKSLQVGKGAGNNIPMVNQQIQSLV